MILDGQESDGVSKTWKKKFSKTVLMIMKIKLLVILKLGQQYSKAIPGLTHYHTMPHFNALKIHSCRKKCEKRRNCLQQAISPFLTIFSTLYGTYFSFQMHFKMLSALYLNLDQTKILLSGNGLKLQVMKNLKF